MSSRMELESRLTRCSNELTGLKSVVRELKQPLSLKQEDILLKDASLQHHQNQLISNQSNLEQLLKINSETKERFEKAQNELIAKRAYIDLVEVRVFCSNSALSARKCMIVKKWHNFFRPSWLLCGHDPLELSANLCEIFHYPHPSEVLLLPMRWSWNGC